MKYLISTLLLTGLLISACDTPLGNLKSEEAGISIPAELPKITYSKVPVRADSIRKAAWEQFKSKNGEKWQIQWNKNTGLPASVFFGLSKERYRGNPKDAALKFLADNAILFGIENLIDFEYVKTNSHKGVQHVTFNQVVNGVPVYKAGYQVHLRSSGQVDMANGTYYPDLSISTSPSISENSAIETARSDMQLSADADLQADAKLVIFREDENFKLAWKLVLFSEEPFADWLYIVDALTGNIITKLNRLTDVTGSGNLYPTSSCRSSVTSGDLYRLNGNGYLDGSYVKAVNSSSSEAYSGSHTFNYSTSNTHFDEVSLYYHVDNFRANFIENLDAGNNLFTKLNAYAHNNSICPNNACFSSTTGDLYFSDYYDFAKEDKVIHHEYSHAVVNDIESDIGTWANEEGAINEGVPDYFAGSFTNYPKILDCSLPAAERDMDNPTISTYSQYQSEDPVSGHDGAELFSAILWNLRSEIGASTTDFLVYDALYRISSNPNFMGFRNALIAADNAAYSSANYPEIQKAFADYEIGTHTPPTVSVSGPGSIPPNSSGVFSATVTSDGDYSSGPYTYQWYYKEIIDHSWTPAGSNSSSYTHYTGSSGAFRVKVEVTYASSIPGSDETSFVIN